MSDWNDPPRSDWNDLALLSEADDPEDYEDLWGAVLDQENFEKLDRETILSGTYTDRPSSAPFDGAKYHATDVNAVFVWDDDDEEWNVLNSGTEDDPVPGTTHLESLSTEQIPTVSGAKIVESGSNDDGEWIRWADGTQIVTIKDLTTDEYEEQADLIDDFVVIEDIYYPRQFDSLHYLDGWAKHDVGTSNLDRHTPLNLRFGRFGSDEYSNTARINRLIIYGPQGDDRWPDRNDTDQIHYSILAIGTWDDTS